MFCHCIFIHCLSPQRKCGRNIQIYLKYPPTSQEFSDTQNSIQILNLHNGKLKFLSHTLDLLYVLPSLNCVPSIYFTHRLNYIAENETSFDAMCACECTQQKKNYGRKKCTVSSQKNNVTQHSNSFVPDETLYPSVCIRLI